MTMEAPTKENTSYLPIIKIPDRMQRGIKSFQPDTPLKKETTSLHTLHNLGEYIVHLITEALICTIVKQHCLTTIAYP